MTTRLFITGTDTDVGKTLISAALLHQLNQLGVSTIGFKPIAAGCHWDTQQGVTGLFNEDGLLLQAASSMRCDYHWHNPIRFAEPIAPHIAALKTHTPIADDTVQSAYQHLLAKQPDVLLTEGAGGWLLPLDYQRTFDAFARKNHMQVVIVVAMRLGCLNHALLTAQQVRQSGCEVVGWVANDFLEQPYHVENIETLKQMMHAPCLGIVKKVAHYREAALQLDIDAINALFIDTNLGAK